MAPPMSHFLDGVCIVTPNKGTDCGATKPSGLKLEWTIGKTLRQELGLWRVLLW